MFAHEYHLDALLVRGEPNVLENFQPFLVYRPVSREIHNYGAVLALNFVDSLVLFECFLSSVVQRSKVARTMGGHFETLGRSDCSVMPTPVPLGCLGKAPPSRQSDIASTELRGASTGRTSGACRTHPTAPSMIANTATGEAQHAEKTAVNLLVTGSDRCSISTSLAMQASGRKSLHGAQSVGELRDHQEERRSLDASRSGRRSVGVTFSHDAASLSVAHSLRRSQATVVSTPRSPLMTITAFSCIPARQPQSVGVENQNDASNCSEPLFYDNGLKVSAAALTVAPLLLPGRLRCQSIDSFHGSSVEDDAISAVSIITPFDGDAESDSGSTMASFSSQLQHPPLRPLRSNCTLSRNIQLFDSFYSGLVPPGVATLSRWDGGDSDNDADGDDFDF